MANVMEKNIIGQSIKTELVLKLGQISVKYNVPQSQLCIQSPRLSINSFGSR